MKTKKILSFFCSVAMLCTMFTAFSMTASAAGTAIEVSDINTLNSTIQEAPSPIVINITADLKAAADFSFIDIPDGKNITINLNYHTIECEFLATSLGSNTDLTINGPGAVKGNKAFNNWDKKTYSNPAVMVENTVKLTANNVNFIGADFVDINSQGASAISATSADIYLNNCYMTAGKSNGTADNSPAIVGNMARVYTKDCTFVRGTGGSGANLNTITGCDVYDLDNKQSITVDPTKSPLIIGKGYTKIPITQDNGAIVSDKTPVTANATIPAPTYTVTIPEKVDFGNVNGALEKYRNKATDRANNNINVQQEFTISAKGVDNLFDGKSLSVSIGTQGTGTTIISGENTIICSLFKGASAYSEGNEFASFVNDIDLASGAENKQTGYVSINRCDIKKTADYTGTMTFNITIKEAI